MKYLKMFEDISLAKYLSQINDNKYNSLTSEIFNNITNEGWVEQLEEFYNRKFTIENFKYTTLNLDNKDKQGLINLEDKTLEKFNSFDVFLKKDDNYPFKILDFIDYDNGIVYIVKHVFFNDKTIAELEKEYSYFHLTSTLLLNKDNKTFTFEPKTPTYPYGFEISIIEDDFTKRVSLGKDISDCLYALPETEYGKFYIYGTKETNFLSVKKQFKNCPIGYGKDFNISKWIKTLPINEQEYIKKQIDLNVHTGVSDLPYKYKKMFYGCVPDANETNEYWSLKPIKMDYLGFIQHDYDNNMYDPSVLKNVKPRYF